MRVSQNAKNALNAARIEGNLVFIDIELDRKTYGEINKLFKAMGGKWSSAKHATVFTTSPEASIDDVIRTGIYTSEKTIFQFFPTPDDLAKKAVALACIKTGERCLEPSAGQGAIARYMPDCDCVELNPRNRAYLMEHGFNLVHDDFMTFAPSQQYDVIVMNPPFNKGQDIAHITRAVSMARRCVVAIASAGVTFAETKAAVEFRKMLDRYGASVEKLPAGVFKESGTSVASVLIVINK